MERECAKHLLPTYSHGQRGFDRDRRREVHRQLAMEIAKSLVHIPQRGISAAPDPEDPPAACGYWPVAQVQTHIRPHTQLAEAPRPVKRRGLLLDQRAGLSGVSPSKLGHETEGKGGGPRRGYRDRRLKAILLLSKLEETRRVRSQLCVVPKSVKPNDLDAGRQRVDPRLRRTVEQTCGAAVFHAEPLRSRGIPHSESDGVVVRVSPEAILVEPRPATDEEPDIRLEGDPRVGAQPRTEISWILV